MTRAKRVSVMLHQSGEVIVVFIKKVGNGFSVRHTREGTVAAVQIEMGGSPDRVLRAALGFALTGLDGRTREWCINQFMEHPDVTRILA